MLRIRCLLFSNFSLHLLRRKNYHEMDSGERVSALTLNPRSGAPRRPEWDLALGTTGSPRTITRLRESLGRRRITAGTSSETSLAGAGYFVFILYIITYEALTQPLSRALTRK